MSKTYYITFGSTDPRIYSGLAPTLIIFADQNGNPLAAPAITEPLAGSGYYKFVSEPTLSIFFLADAGGTVVASDRYIKGALDPIQAVDEKVGTLSDSYGATNIDPSTVIGYLKRAQEFFEGNKIFTKSTAIWDIYSRGSSTLLVEKQLTNTITSATSS